ncbi:Lcl domain-containing protein [Parabacteroides sp.]
MSNNYLAGIIRYANQCNAKLQYIYKTGICLWILILCGSGSLSAQVATTVNGYPVIDLTALKPLGCILSSSEAAARTVEINGKTATTDQFLDRADGAISGTDGKWNEKMSSRIQVMRNNYSAGYTWVNAYEKCKTYEGEGGAAGEWRLPTQREQQIIKILHPQLVGKGGFTAYLNNSTYWTATEFTTGNAWYVGISGSTAPMAKANTGVARCVRDL